MRFNFVENFVTSIAVLFIISWLWNATKLASCDFKSPYKCEFIHGVGFIVMPLSFVTVWFGDDGA